MPLKVERVLFLVEKSPQKSLRPRARGTSFISRFFLGFRLIPSACAGNKSLFCVLSVFSQFYCSFIAVFTAIGNRIN
jgi:hypothetical protein